MKALAAVLVVLTVSTSFAAKSDKSEDEKAVAQAMVDKLIAAMNANDATAFVSGWAEDGVLIDPFAARGNGKADAGKIIAGDLATLLQGTKSKATLERVRKLGNDAIFADADVTHENALMLNGSRGTVATHWALAMAKKGKTWQVTDVRFYMFAPPPPK